MSSVIDNVFYKITKVSDFGSAHCMNAVCVCVCVYSSTHKNGFRETESIKSFC